MAASSYSIGSTAALLHRNQQVGSSRPPIRICFVIDRLLRGGTEMQLLALIRHLDRQRFEPYLCLLDGRDEVSRSLEPTDIPVERWGIRSLGDPMTLVSAVKFTRFLRRERIEILQLYFTDSTTFGVVVGCLAGVPNILRVRNNIGHWMTPRLRRRFRVLNRFVTLVLTNSQQGLEAVVAQEGIPPGSVRIMRNCVDFGRFPDRPRVDFPQRSSGKRVGIVANLRRVKGLDILLDAAATVLAADPRVVISIAGESHADENLRPALEQQAARLGISGRVEFVGRVDDVLEFLQTLDVAVLPSRAEGTSNALIEYKAMGLPIVATAVGGSTSLVSDGVDGLLVAPEDPAGLGAAILELIRDAEKSCRLGRAAYQSVREQFGMNGVGEDYEQLYESLGLVPRYD